MISFKNIILGIAIAIIFALTVGYGIYVFYAEPLYDQYCNFTSSPPFAEPVKIAPDQAVCNQNVSDAVSRKSMQCDYRDTIPHYTYDSKGCQIDVFCDPCQGKWQSAQEKYTRNLFLITAIVGILGILFGAVYFGIESVGAGLMGGGVLTILYGAIRSWTTFGKQIQFVMLLAGLIILIGLGYWINRKKAG